MFQQHPFWHWLSNCTLFLSSFRMCKINFLMFDDSTTIYVMFPLLFSLWFLGHCHAWLLFELLSKGMSLTIAIPEKINSASVYVLFLRLAYPLHRIEFGPLKFSSKTFRFSIIFCSTLQKNEWPRRWNFWTKRQKNQEFATEWVVGGVEAHGQLTLSPNLPCPGRSKIVCNHQSISVTSIAFTVVQFVQNCYNFLRSL